MPKAELKDKVAFARRSEGGLLGSLFEKTRERVGLDGCCATAKRKCKCGLKFNSRLSITHQSDSPTRSSREPVC